MDPVLRGRPFRQHLRPRPRARPRRRARDREPALAPAPAPPERARAHARLGRRPGAPPRPSAPEAELPPARARGRRPRRAAGGAPAARLRRARHARLRARLRDRPGAPRQPRGRSGDDPGPLLLQLPDRRGHAAPARARRAAARRRARQEDAADDHARDRGALRERREPRRLRRGARRRAGEARRQVPRRRPHQSRVPFRPRRTSRAQGRFPEDRPKARRDMTSESSPTRAHEHVLEIAAAPEAVWKAITEAEELVRWFPQDAKVKPGKGGEIVYCWGGLEGRCRILAWQPPKHLRTGWMEAPTPETKAPDLPRGTAAD